MKPNCINKEFRYKLSVMTNRKLESLRYHAVVIPASLRQNNPTRSNPAKLTFTNKNAEKFPIPSRPPNFDYSRGTTRRKDGTVIRP